MNLDNKCKRICLFAAFDKKNHIHQYVIDYITELTKYCDVYYLADCNMTISELGKLKEITKGAWSIPHGMYDFGSYAMLANELVGWDVIDAYDELMFVNDSCYLIKPLAEVFQTMKNSESDWWGLQATKGYAVTKNKASNCFRQPINIEQVKQNLPSYFNEKMYDFLVGSYFLCFRKKVIVGKELKCFLTSIKSESNKLNIVRKYEIGLTKLLISKGYDFDLFINKLYPFHPVYSLYHFDLIKDGFPLLKKRLLAVNHYKVSGLNDWKEKILAINPQADIKIIEDNLIQDVGLSKLNNNISIKSGNTRFTPYPVFIWLPMHHIKQTIKKFVGQEIILVLKDIIIKFKG